MPARNQNENRPPSRPAREGGPLMTLQIERMSYGPDAIAHDPDGKTVFVSGGAVPGDVVETSLEEERPTFSRARLQRVAQPSDQRVDAPCPFVGLCGGCPWAHLSRQAQLDEKRDGVVGALTRIGHFDQDRAERLVAPAERPGNDWGYRNKIELGFSREGRRTVVGMHEDNGNGLVKVDACPLLDAQDKRLVKSLAGAMGYVSNAFDLSFERIGVRSSSRTRDVEVSLWTSPGGFPRGKVAKVLGDALRATSVVHVLSKGPSKARRVVGVERLSGKGYWTERVAGGRMALSAPSFFQVNTAGAERLVQLVMDALQPSEDDEAMDLYCGAGTFTLPLARSCAFVSAVESYGPAVRDLRRNLEHAQLDNVDAIGGDAGREFPDTDADVIVVDPPRAGLAEDVVRRLSEQPARAIAYVSCDPATLARDLARFEDLGTFEPVRVTPVDLFPQTFHVETVTVLERSR